MSSLYLHIPFCKQACHYCDFHFSTNLSQKSKLVEAICQEIVFQKDYLDIPDLNTIYFGGGTPSLLAEQELAMIFQTIASHFRIQKDAEITLEANPDDLQISQIQLLKKYGINRLSIGIQSFHHPHLQYLHRVHQAIDAEKAVKSAQDLGIENITIDLIYAIPAENHSIWENDLQKAVALDVKHISAYCLTIEEKTVFGNWLKKNKIKAVDENFAAEQFEILIQYLENQGFEQYEISNFAQPSFESRHNSNYWKKGNYLGIGPSAHSYNGFSRQFNIANNSKYIQSIQNNIIPFEKEILSTKDQINEYLMTSLRTKWGFDLDMIKKRYNFDFIQVQKKFIQTYLAQNLLFFKENTLFLTAKGKLLADEITANLFLI